MTITLHSFFFANKFCCLKELWKCDILLKNRKKDFEGKMDSNETKRVICIPSKPCRTLSEAVKYYICALLPKGKLLTEKAFEEFVAAKMGVEYVLFSANLWDKMTNVEDILQYDRTYRLISNVGRVSNVHVEKLAQEGFTLVPATMYMSKIVDYKDYLWNVERETKIDKDLIERVNANGFVCLKELAGICE